MLVHYLRAIALVVVLAVVLGLYFYFVGPPKDVPPGDAGGQTSAPR